MPVPKYALSEFERRFLVLADVTELVDGNYVAIDDLYVTGARLRLRRIRPSTGGPETFKLCKKYGDDGAAGDGIVNIYLTADEHALLGCLPGQPITKRRYHRVWNDIRYALDIFAGDLAGLILTEVEAADAMRLRAVQAPPWAYAEVTDDEWFRGGNLATQSADALAIRLRQATQS